MALNEASIGLAFGAGLLASVNPCGFAMLPAFVSYYLASRASEGASRGRVVDGLGMGLVVTAGFLLVFAVVGAIFSLGTRAIVHYLPWLAIVVGIGLAGAGVWLLAGHHLSIRLPGLPSAAPESTGYRSIFLFGIAYAVGSLSCTLPIFLVVIGSGLTAGSALPTLAVFLAYGLGMATVLMLLCLGTAGFRELLVRKVRRALPYVSRVSGGLLVTGGAYVVYYWGTILAGQGKTGPVRFVSDLQGRAQQFVLGIDPRVWFVVGATLALAALGVLLKRPAPLVPNDPSGPDEELDEIQPRGATGDGEPLLRHEKGVTMSEGTRSRDG